MLKKLRFKHICNDDNDIGHRKQPKLAYHTHTYSYFIKNHTTNVHVENRVKHYRLNKHQLINERLKILNLHCGSTKLVSLFLSE